MKTKNTFLAIIASVCLHYSYGQIPPEYTDFIKKADSLYKAKNYKASALAYSAAFECLGWKGIPEDRYNAARAWALAYIPDSAFFNLERIITKSFFSDYERLTTDTELFSLHDDKRWKPLLALIEKNLENKSLRRQLDSLAKEDQKWRVLWEKYANNEKDSVPLDTILKYWRMTDSLNYSKVREIFLKYGFPNDDLVGQQGSENFWLLVQHQDRHPQFQDSVLAAMKIEVDKGKASASNYAYLVDRVNVNTNKPQVYGTQMQLNKDGTSYEPKPVIEPEKLNERRKSMGLTTIQEYIEMMNKHNYGSLKKN